MRERAKNSILLFYNILSNKKVELRANKLILIYSTDSNYLINDC